MLEIMLTQHALENTAWGGVQAVSIAGHSAIFSHKGDKKGQQDAYIQQSLWNIL